LTFSSVGLLWAFLSRLLLSRDFSRRSCEDLDDLFSLLDDEDLLVLALLLVVLLEGLGDFLEGDRRFSFADGSESEKETCSGAIPSVVVHVVVSTMLSVLFLLLLSSSLFPMRAAMMVTKRCVGHSGCWFDWRNEKTFSTGSWKLQLTTLRSLFFGVEYSTNTARIRITNTLLFLSLAQDRASIRQVAAAMHSVQLGY
jgi:hypothetical protein